MARLDVVVDREEGRGDPPEFGGVPQEGLGLGGAHALVAATSKTGERKEKKRKEKKRKEKKRISWIG